jgi:hypothetical protein
MDCFKIFKYHNMFVFMLDPSFRYSSFVGDYVGHALIIEIVGKCDS